MNVHRYQVRIEREGDFTFDAGDWLSALQLALVLVEHEDVVERLRVEVLPDGSVLCVDPVEGRTYEVRAMTYQGRPVEEFTLPPARAELPREADEADVLPASVSTHWMQPALAGLFAFLLTLALMALVL